MPKKNGRKRSSASGAEEAAKALQEMIAKLHERQRLEEERQAKWNEAWERKLAQDEYCEDLAACNAPDEYFPPARAQANVWLQVGHEKNTQRVQLSFMNVKVAKPPAPPLPRLPPPVEEVKEEEKPNGKKKKKKKK